MNNFLPTCKHYSCSTKTAMLRRLGLTWGAQAEKPTIFLLIRDDRVVRNKYLETKTKYLLTVLENRLLLGSDNA